MSRKFNRFPVKESQDNNMTQIEKYNDVMSSLDTLQTNQKKITPKTDNPIPFTKIIFTVTLFSIISLGILSLSNIPIARNNLSGQTIDSPKINFSFQLLNGTEVSLADYKGAPLFLDLFATWCQPCKAQIAELAKLKSFSPYVRILSVSIEKDDTVEMLEKFSSETGITWIVGRDYSLQGARNFNVTSIPTLAFFNSEGVLKKLEAGIHDYATMASWLSENY
ncbi:MAG: TlpA family protein disulfide reductase [Candidatus Hodarchaeota archaeon]